MIDISNGRLSQIVLLARSFDEQARIARQDTSILGDPIDLNLGRSPENSAEQQLRKVIDGLSDDEQAVLVALIWIGRGDFTPAEFDHALSAAFERRTGLTSQYLVNFPMLADLIERGAAACETASCAPTH